MDVGDGTSSPWLLVATAMSAGNAFSVIPTGAAGGGGGGGFVVMASDDGGAVVEAAVKVV